MSSIQTLNAGAEHMSRAQALRINAEAAKGLQHVLKSNLGPRGTLKLLVGGAGQLKLTKDGSCLLSEMQIQHPTAVLIARAANAMDDSVGDGTTTSVLFTGELLRQADRYLADRRLSASQNRYVRAFFRLFFVFHFSWTPAHATSSASLVPRQGVAWS